MLMDGGDFARAASVSYVNGHVYGVRFLIPITVPQPITRLLFVVRNEPFCRDDLGIYYDTRFFRRE